jgi:hypothetical protein
LVFPLRALPLFVWTQGNPEPCQPEIRLSVTTSTLGAFRGVQDDISFPFSFTSSHQMYTEKPSTGRVEAKARIGFPEETRDTNTP